MTELDETSGHLVAKNPIKHGNEDGSVTAFEPGDEITGLDDDTVEALLASDSIGEPDEETSAALDENDRLKRQVADLTAQLQDALSKKTPQQQTGGQSSGAGGNLPQL